MCMSLLCGSGVDVCIRDFNRKSIHIREARRVKVGHIATGISYQVRASSLTDSCVTTDVHVDLFQCLMLMCVSFF